MLSVVERLNGRQVGRPPPVARRTRFVLLDYYDANQSVASREAAVFSFSLIRAIYVTGGVEKPEGDATQDATRLV